MLTINYITFDSETSGVSKYEEEIRKRIQNVTYNVISYPYQKINIRGLSFFYKTFNKVVRFPSEVKRKIQQDAITHITSQNFVYLLNFLNLPKCIVTCYDMASVHFKNRYSPYLKITLMALKKADRIITISNFSKNEIIKYTAYPKEKITVVYEGVSHQKYKPLKTINKKVWLIKYGIPENKKIILYIGSERPRKNLPTLFK